MSNRVPWFGIHAGLQRTTPSELIAVWQHAEQLGFEWASVWDHFYAADQSGDANNLEAIACHAAMATTTKRVRCGSLVYSTGFRHPAVLANAIATIDHLSGGRAVLGLGGGWLASEYAAYGFEYGTPASRLRKLNEAIQCISSLLREEVTNFSGEFFTLTDARCEPKPIQARLQLWIGGGGERFTLRIAAQYADGWNIPFVSSEEWARKSGVLDEHCRMVGRDPKAVTRTVNLGLVRNESDLDDQFGALAPYVRPGVLVGTDGADRLLEQIAGYIEAGAEGIIFAMRAPFHSELLEQLAGDVLARL